MHKQFQFFNMTLFFPRSVQIPPFQEESWLHNRWHVHPRFWPWRLCGWGLLRCPQICHQGWISGHHWHLWTCVGSMDLGLCLWSFRWWENKTLQFGFFIRLCRSYFRWHSFRCSDFPLGNLPCHRCRVDFSDDAHRLPLHWTVWVQSPKPSCVSSFRHRPGEQHHLLLREVIFLALSFCRFRVYRQSGRVTGQPARQLVRGCGNTRRALAGAMLPPRWPGDSGIWNFIWRKHFLLNVHNELDWIETRFVCPGPFLLRTEQPVIFEEVCLFLRRAWSE